jgi:UDP:flavonoid glycosyltransferase YjiC (YdhE family)
MLRTGAMFADRGPGEDLLASVGRQPADLVVVDCLSLGALAAAERAGLRRAVLVHTFHRFLQPWRRGPMGLIAGLKGLHPARYWSTADLTLVTTLRELDPGPLPENVRHTGAVWQGETAPAVPDPGRDPLVLVSLSTTYFPGQPEALQSIVDTLAGLPVRVVVTTGPAIDPATLRLPPNAEAHRYVPHDQLLPQASLVIGHGGHATTMRALAHDLPIVVVPMHPMLDQRMIGGAVARAGAGRVVAKGDITANMRGAVLELLADGPHRAAAARLGTQIRERDGAVTAADHLEGLLRELPAHTRVAR